MPSTDRLLWLLQIVLLLSVPLLWLAIFTVPYPITSGDDCGNWVYSYPEGVDVLVRPEHCPEPESTDPISPLNVVLLGIGSLWTLALGAIIFCLRRIGRAMGAR